MGCGNPVKRWMAGNEAIARGAWEAGCRVGTAYPGTPSTEILQFLSEYPEVNAEWSPNEKVALEVAAGAARRDARAAKLPMLEPADSEEARRLVKLAFALSEEYDCPVLVRTTTRISHGEGLVETEDRRESPLEIKLEKNPAKWVMLPAYARARRPLVEARMEKLVRLAESFA